jgi:hypothetical protein
MQTTLVRLDQSWESRLARVRRSQARVNPAGMTRPPRDTDERRFLLQTGQLGPFVESSESASVSQSSETT